jgi:hypothetical protein
MAKKTFKPGEYAHGGLIKVELTKTQIKINFVDMFDKTTVVAASTFSTVGSRGDVEMFVTEHATPYYGDQVCEWLDSKLDDPKSFRMASGGWC